MAQYFKTTKLYKIKTGLSFSQLPSHQVLFRDIPLMSSPYVSAQGYSIHTPAYMYMHTRIYYKW